MPDLTVENAFTGILAACFVLAMVILGMTLAGCPLHDPVPCSGEPYPAPCAARDAGR